MKTKLAIVLAGVLAVLSTGCGVLKALTEVNIPDNASAENTQTVTEAPAQTAAAEQPVSNETMTEAVTEPVEVTTSAGEVTEFDPDAVTVMSMPSFEMPEITVTKFSFDSNAFDASPLGITADDVLSGNITAAETKAENELTTASQAAGGTVTITDDSGGFTYTGELQQIGDDEHGYVMVPADFVKFKDVETTGAVQYSDVTGKNIVTVTKYTGTDYETAAQSALAYMDEASDITGGTGARLKVAGYDSIQCYGMYDDGFFIVVWMIKDPANENDSYYLCFEFDGAHSDIMACSSTFQTSEDHNR